MAESASVPLQLQSVALRRGGFKRFVKAIEEEVVEEEKNVSLLRCLYSGISVCKVLLGGMCDQETKYIFTTKAGHSGGRAGFGIPKS